MRSPVRKSSITGVPGRSTLPSAGVALTAAPGQQAIE